MCIWPQRKPMNKTNAELRNTQIFGWAQGNAAPKKAIRLRNDKIRRKHENENCSRSSQENVMFQCCGTERNEIEFTLLPSIDDGIASNATVAASQ